MRARVTIIRPDGSAGLSVFCHSADELHGYQRVFTLAGLSFQTEIWTEA